MDELLQEFVDSRGTSLRVDRDAGILRGVKLLGLESRNGRRYLPAALRDATSLYEGAKVNVNHPKGHPLAARDYQDRLGVIHAVQWRDGSGLFGDLHFNPKHQLAEQLLWDALHAPHNVGLSHNVQARTARQGDELVVEAILKVQSVDLVADPATTRGLFEAVSPAGAGLPKSSFDWSAVTLEQLQDHRPDLVTALKHDESNRLRQLQEELDGLRLEHGLQVRRERALRLLREYKLPAPGGNDELAQAIVSPTWFESLLTAESEAAMRTMLSERAELVAALGRQAAAANRPVSREQQAIPFDALQPLDVAAFARSLR
jgi:hypothetical protein